MEFDSSFMKNMKKLEKLADERDVSVTPDMMNHVIGCSHQINVKLVHIIKTEDEVKSSHDIPKEIMELNGVVAKEWLVSVIEPFCENIIKFMKKHPEYGLKTIDTKGCCQTFNSLLKEDMNEMLDDNNLEQLVEFIKQLGESDE